MGSTAKTIPVLSMGPPWPGPVVGHLGLLVHGGPDGVAHVLPDDREPGPLGHVLDGPAHLVEAVPAAELLDPGPQAALGDLDEPGGLGRDLPDGHGEGGVAVVALDDRPAVDRQDVALLEDVLARGCRGRSCRWARCRSPPGSPGSGGSWTWRPGGSSTSRATASSSAVVTPGLAAARVASCISATTCPARRILAISSALRLIAAFPLAPALLHGPDDPAQHGVGRPHPADLGELRRVTRTSR